MINAYKILFRKNLRGKSIAALRNVYGWKDNIKMDFYNGGM
jgi:hypothetical protein